MDGITDHDNRGKYSDYSADVGADGASSPGSTGEPHVTDAKMKVEVVCPVALKAVGCTKASAGAGDINSDNAKVPVVESEVVGADVSSVALLHHPGLLLDRVKWHPLVAVKVMISFATSHNPLV